MNFLNELENYLNTRSKNEDEFDKEIEAAIEAEEKKSFKAFPEARLLSDFELDRLIERGY